MITNVIHGDIFTTPCKHIAFAINTEGFNDSGFAGKVCQYASGFSNTGKKKLGEVVSITTDDKTYHGLVCHSLTDNGWKEAPKAITECLEKIDTSNGESIAVILMGAGMIGMLSGANVKENLKAIHRSKKECIVYTFEYSEKAVWDVIGK